MIRKAIEESQREEQERMDKLKSVEQQEAEKLAMAQASSTQENELAKQRAELEAREQKLREIEEK